MYNKKIDVILDTMNEENISVVIHFLLNHIWLLNEVNNLKPKIKNKFIQLTRSISNKDDL